MSGAMQGGSMGGVDELYREVILDHFKSPKNRGELPGANAHADGMNPLCGDQLSMSALIEGGKVKDVKFEGHGCAISQSAASMFTVLAKGRPLAEVRELASTFKKMFGLTEAGESRFSQDDLGDLISLEGVRKYPVRIKCALLSANTLLESLEQFEKKGA